ncbi:hypothetical protein MGLY_32960 [Neomoorella glycerini]|uniref:DUF5320 domain-containing protein n=1 Tax=Neomoorella glycerini TaxID=55779 RepID=A0A6I5ZV17_9FIRM|nr:DUF5320 domain-containing protein [Moorella glycerini]QGP93873.1 hypothetical protein MGLY_32960 [Moorella glycerini]
MPRGDRTGPWGLGPRTGRGAGYCNGFPVPGFMNPAFGFGRGLGLGLGRGRGLGLGRRWAWGFFPPSYGWFPGGWWGAPFPGAVPPQGAAPEVEFLKQQAAVLEGQLKAVKEQLKALQQEERQDKADDAENEDL